MPGHTGPGEEYFKDGIWGWDTNTWRQLIADVAGHLQIDVVTSGLPAGGATAANQATMITALQLIDDLQRALSSIGLDQIDTVVRSSVLPTGAATSANQATAITALQLIDDLTNALDSVGTDELDVNVEASVLPTGAATSANQATAITALQLIDNLTNALASVATDRLRVEIVSEDYVHVQDRKVQNTPGGAFTFGAWRTRDINDEVTDTAGICTIAGNQITLEAGTYRCAIYCPAYLVNQHQAQLYDTTGTAVLVLGQNAHSRTAADGASVAVVRGRFTLAIASALEVQHRCTTTQAVNGFGPQCNWGDEIYTIAEFWRLVV